MSSFPQIIFCTCTLGCLNCKYDLVNMKLCLSCKSHRRNFMFIWSCYRACAIKIEVWQCEFDSRLWMLSLSPPPPLPPSFLTLAHMQANVCMPSWPCNGTSKLWKPSLHGTCWGCWLYTHSEKEQGIRTIIKSIHILLCNVYMLNRIPPVKLVL